MKNVLKISTISIASLFLIYLCSHRPTEDEFYIWLQSKYSIKCNEAVTCTKEVETNSYSTLIETGSNIKNGYLLFNTVGKVYEDENGTRTTIKALGVLGKYFTITEDEKPPLHEL